MNTQPILGTPKIIFDEKGRNAIRLPAGAWDDEPDLKKWIDEATGMKCLVRRGWSGGLCGYVKVPFGHPAYRKSKSGAINKLRVHGGVTFNGGRPMTLTYREKGWWVGFDCMHGGDLVPGLIAMDQIMGLAVFRDSVYRDFDYAVEQCRLLAAQLFQHTKGKK